MLIRLLSLLFPFIFGFGIVGGEGGGATGGEGGAGAEGSEGKDAGEADDGGAEGGDKGKGGKGSGGDFVSRADHQRALEDLHKEKQRRKELEAADKKRKEDSLKEQNRWKEYAESKEAEAKAARDEADQSANAFKDSVRHSRVVELANKLGLKTEARDDLDLLDLDSVIVEKTDSGRYIVRGADKFVENLKKSKPHWFKAPTPPKFNGGGGREHDTGGKQLTEKDVAAIEQKYGQNSPQFRKAYNQWVESLTKPAKG